MLAEKLAALRLPPLMVSGDGTPVDSAERWRVRRRELIELLSRVEYGYTPPAPRRVYAEPIPEPNRQIGDQAYADKAVQQRIELSFETPGGPFTFPIVLIVPKAVARAPVFVNIAFRRELPDRYLPVEEIIDRGYAIATYCYEDVTSDNVAEFDKLGALYPRDARTGWGKIGIWAFAASRVLDYLETRADIDAARACVTGHSRLGKTALWCGAQDERFAMVVSNDSGCGGAALTRDKQGEQVTDSIRLFPYWYCGNYASWQGRAHEMPFDQHMLLALIAPRRLYVCSAEKDSWADPEHEFLSCVAASEAWTVQRVPGLVTPDALPVPDSPLHEGGICYHMRRGTHFFSRTDWLHHMACRDRYHI